MICDPLGCKCLLISLTAFSTGEIVNTRILSVLRYRYFGVGIIPISSPVFSRYRYPDTDTVLRYFRYDTVPVSFTVQNIKSPFHRKRNSQLRKWVRDCVQHEPSPPTTDYWTRFRNLLRPAMTIDRHLAKSLVAGNGRR